MEKIAARFLQNRLAVAGACVVGAFLFLSVFSPWLTPYDPTEQNLLVRLSGPSLRHPLGTDEFGRDVLSRLMVGARLSFGIGFFAVLLAFVAGGALGLVSGYYGGFVDLAIMHFVDILMSFPGMLLALVFVAVLGVGEANVTLAIGVATIPVFTRVVRGSVLGIKNLEYIESARAMGSRDLRIMWRYIWPNVVGPVIILATLRIATAILTAAALSFIGLGVQPPKPEWGAMLSEGRAYLRTSPHVVTFPGLAIMMVVLAFNLMGDGLRDALDPQTVIRGKSEIPG